MSERKNRREIDKAVRHLMEYGGPNNEWVGRLDELIDEFISPVAEELDLAPDEAADYFFGGPLAHMAFGFVFEDYATAHWDNEEHSLISAYLQHRGWRESGAGRRYLQGLGQSELNFWEVTAVKPGAYVDVRAYGSKQTPIRVKEKAAGESLAQWDSVAARVIPTGHGYIFSGALLPFNPELAKHVNNMLVSAEERVTEIMQELVDSGEIDALPDNMDEVRSDTLRSELPGVAFSSWAVEVYSLSPNA